MAARESLPRRGHWSPIQPCRDGGALQGEDLGTHQEKWGGGAGASVPGPVQWGDQQGGFCAGGTDKGWDLGGGAERETSPAPLSPPFTAERAGRWCFLRRYLRQEPPVQPPETTELAV